MSVNRSPKPTARPKSNPRLPDPHRGEAQMARAIDALAEFEEYQTEILPILKQMVKSKATSTEMIEQARPLLVAKLVSIAMSSEDEGRRASMALALLDRIDGKPVERKQVVHAMAKLKDEELDAMLLTALAETDGEDK